MTQKQTERQLSQLVALVDDEPEILQALESLLAFKGVACSVHESGESLLEAVTLLEGQLWLPREDKQLARLNAVVLDINLPGMSGADLVQALRRLQPQLKIVMITAALADQLQAGAQDLQDFTIVYKPFRLETLEKALQEACARCTARPR